MRQPPGPFISSPPAIFYDFMSAHSDSFHSTVTHPLFLCFLCTVYEVHEESHYKVESILEESEDISRFFGLMNLL